MLIHRHKINTNNVMMPKAQEQGVFHGYASVFMVKDSHNDVILPGAFRDSINQHEKIRILWQHDVRYPIGLLLQAYEDQHGLYVCGKLLLELQCAKEAYKLIKSSIIQHLSIGYQILDSYREGRVRYIKHIKLWEISIVTFAANSKAVISNVKALS